MTTCPEQHKPVPDRKRRCSPMEKRAERTFVGFASLIYEVATRVFDD